MNYENEAGVMQDEKAQINSKLIRITLIFSFLKKVIEKESSLFFFRCRSILVQETKNGDTTLLGE